MDRQYSTLKRRVFNEQPEAEGNDILNLCYYHSVTNQLTVYPIYQSSVYFKNLERRIQRERQYYLGWDDRLNHWWRTL